MKLFDIIYARVSTDEQAKDGKTSINEQIEGCKKLLTNHGYTNFKIFKEDYSGFEYDRPELNKIKELMTDGQVRSFCVLRVDRLCRKTSVLEKIRDGYFKPLGVEVFSDDLGGRWSWNSQQETIQETLAVFSSYWGKMAVQILQDGRKAHVKAGNIVTCGRPPLGLTEVVTRDYNGKRLSASMEFNQSEAAIVLRIYENFVSDDMSLNAIARALNEDNIPTYSMIRGDKCLSTHRKESKAANHWRVSTVRQILANPAYDGRWQFGRRRTVKKRVNGKIVKKIIRDASQAITVEIDRLIPADVWQKAQQLLKNVSAKAGAPTKYEYLLRRRMLCSCNFKMNCHTKEKGKYLYYVCTANRSGVECDISSLRADEVDAIAWRWLYELLTDRNKLKSKLDNYFEEQQKTAKPLIEKLALVNSLLEKKEKELGEMLASFFKLSESLQARAMPQMDRLEKEIVEYKEESEALQKDITKLELTTDGIKSFVDRYHKEAKNEFLDINASFQKRLKKYGYYDIPENQKKWHANVNLGALAGIIRDDKELTFEDRQDQVKKFDLRVTVLDKERIFVQCKVDSAILGLNSTFDYDVTDGAPVIRFIQRLTELLEQSHGLDG